MRTLIALAMIGMVSLIGAARGGEVDETANLRAEVAKLAKRVEELDRKERLFQGGSSWVDKVSISGDFRYRHEMIKQDLNIEDVDETERHRHRIRARLTIKGQVNEEVTMELRLASGSTDPVSTNQTLDNEFQTKNFSLDRANVKYAPEALKDFGMSFQIGKFGNPFHKPEKTQLIWDGDLSFEGGNMKAKFKVDPVEIFIVGAALWVEENGTTADNGLWGIQPGVKWPIMDTGITFVGGVGGFWYTPVKHEGPFDDYFGNSEHPDGDGYEYDFNLLEVFGELHFKLMEFPIVVYGDIVDNTNAPNEGTGYLFGITVGKKKKQWDWDFKYNYRDLEQDAVIGTFTDSDTGGGGTNIRGHKIGFGLRLMKNVDFGFTYMINDVDVEGIDPIGEHEVDYDRMQLDLKFKF